mgnify:CR=1 FL=1
MVQLDLLISGDDLMTDLKFVEKLDQVTVQRVLDGSATLAEFNQLKNPITDRLNYVVRKIVELSNLELDWWDFDNLGEGNEDHGVFDPVSYSSSVGIYRKCYGSSYKNMCFEKYKDQIPVEFIWSNFEDKVASEFEDFKNHIDVNNVYAANKAFEAKQKMESIMESIKSKLTPEELSHIQFKFQTGSKKHRK